MNDVYCRKCRKPISAQIACCPHCGTDQQAYSQQIPTPQPVAVAAPIAPPVVVPPDPSPQTITPQHNGMSPLFAMIIMMAFSAITITGVIFYYHNHVVKSIELELAQTKKELKETHDKLDVTQQSVESLTDTVNHNASIANYNSSLR